MGKNKKRRRMNPSSDDGKTSLSIAASIVSNRKKRQAAVNLDDDEDETMLGVSPSDLDTTIRTLTALANFSEDLSLPGKEFKGLRRALHPFQEAYNSRFDPVDYPARVTTLLESKHWSPALFALEACAYYYGGTDSVKRGTIQRWVRFCNDCADTNLQHKLLNAVLKSSASTATETSTTDGDSEHINKHDPRRALTELEAARENSETTAIPIQSSEPPAPSPHEEKQVIWHAPVSSSFSSEEYMDDGWVIEPSDIRVVHHIAAPDRKPPNHYDLNIFAVSLTASNHIVSHDYNSSRLQLHSVKAIPGVLFLANVLTPRDCRRIIATTETMGYSPDHPTDKEQPTGIDTCEWLAERESQQVFDRIQQFLPNADRASGINARWRLFRYGPDSIYRPHIDGSWPGSRLVNDEYVSDESQTSCYTFLVYLNDDFEGGGTTFYIVGDGGDSSLRRVTVKPKTGSVLIFPQGNTASLLHEGSRVESMARSKYVIRTDVLYRR